MEGTFIRLFEIVCERLGWIHLAEYKVHRRDVVNLGVT